MKTRVFGDWIRCFRLLLLAYALPHQAADVAFYSVSKGLKYNQDSPAAPILGSNGYRFAADVAPATSNSVVSATVMAPGGAAEPLTPDLATSWFSINAKAATQAQLDSLAPNVKYTFVINTAHDGQRTVSLALSAPQYPTAPHLSNFPAAQSIDPGRAFTLTWDPFTGGTAQDVILVSVGDAAKTTLLFSSPGPFQPGALDGTATSVLIPAGILQPNAQYLAEINFIKVKGIDEVGYPGSAGVVAFNSFTDVSMATAASTAPAAQFQLYFRQFAQGGKFLGGTNAFATFPAALNGYRAEVTVTNDSSFPPAAQVLISGPPGSGLTNTPADTAASSIGATSASYFSPRLTQPGTAPGGTWSINYKGVKQAVTVPDPQLTSDLAIPLPDVTMSSDLLKAVTWSFYGASGAALSGVPAYVSGLHVQALDASGAFILDSGPLPSAALTYSLAAPLNWATVNTVRFMYNDNRGDSYVIGFPKIATNPFSLAAVQDSTASGFVLRLSGDVGRGYLLQYSPDLVHWTNLVTTNLTSPSITLPDSSARTAPTRFYRAELAN